MEKLKILKCEAKEGAQHVRVYTDKGWYSAFDEAKAMCLQSIDKYLNCEIRETESKGRQYKNIIKAEMIEGSTETPLEQAKANVARHNANWGLREYEKCPVGLSVEMFATLRKLDRFDNLGDIELMKLSTEVIKLARKAF